MSGLAAWLGVCGAAQAQGVTLPKPKQQGLEAIQALAQRLPDVARDHALDAPGLQRILMQDANAWLDASARLFYDEPVLPADLAAASTSPSAGAGVAEAPLADTFRLHSRPGANHVIYLDFDGQLVTGTIWNSNHNNGDPIDAQAYDIGDGSGPGVFSDAELLRIQEIWQRVAEDYAPFEVDVTTEEPAPADLVRSGSGDSRWGVRVIVTITSAWYGSAGGVAYYNSFNNSYDNPCWVFANRLGSGNARYTAEACSHEVGHTLNLRHDGTASTSYYQGHGSGDIGWAPIMGVGYYRLLVQFDDGSYEGSNNTQDDLAVIINGNGFGYRMDDHGDRRADATPLSAAALRGAGVIETRADVDVFSFQANAGAATFTFSPDSASGNLDILVRLLDGNGQEIAMANPADRLGATISATLPAAGTYTLHVEGVGNANCSDYASVGQYSFSGTAPAPSGPFPPTAAASANVTTGKAPLAIAFSSQGSLDLDGAIVAYAWDFGDGATSDQANPNHAYAAAGTYTARLTVTDNANLSASDMLTITVLPPNQAPTAAIAPSATTGAAPLAISFDGRGSRDPDGTQLSYSWSFGDGAVGMGSQVSHTFAEGTWTVRLTVTDVDGASGTAQVTVTVTPDPSLGAPSGLSASLSGSTVSLSWTQGSGQETGFYVERAVKSGRGKNAWSAFTRVATVGADVTQYSEALADGQYRYRVQAFRAAETSGFSNTLDVSLGASGGGGNGKKSR